MLQNRPNHQPFWQRKAIYGKAGQGIGQDQGLPKARQQGSGLGSGACGRSAPTLPRASSREEKTPPCFGTVERMEKSQGTPCQGRAASASESRTARAGHPRWCVSRAGVIRISPHQPHAPQEDKTHIVTEESGHPPGQAEGDASFQPPVLGDPDQSPMTPLGHQQTSACDWGFMGCDGESTERALQQNSRRWGRKSCR